MEQQMQLDDPGVFGGPIDEDRLRAYWDSMSPSYAPGADTGLVRFSHHRQHGAALRLAEPAAGQSVLDAGAGSGLLTRRLVDLGCEVTAVDASEAMIAQLREVSPSAQVGRLETLALDTTFDRVMAIGVLNFVCDPADVLRRLCRHVKPGGILVLQVTEWSLFGLTYWINYWLKGFKPFLFSRDWLTRMVRRYGFEPAGYEHPLPHDLTIAFRRRADAEG